MLLACPWPRGPSTLPIAALDDHFSIKRLRIFADEIAILSVPILTAAPDYQHEAVFLIGVASIRLVNRLWSTGRWARDFAVRSGLPMLI